MADVTDVTGVTGDWIAFWRHQVAVHLNRNYVERQQSAGVLHGTMASAALNTCHCTLTITPRGAAYCLSSALSNKWYTHKICVHSGQPEPCISHVEADSYLGTWLPGSIHTNRTWAVITAGTAQT